MNRDKLDQIDPCDPKYSDVKKEYIIEFNKAMLSVWSIHNIMTFRTYTDQHTVSHEYKTLVSYNRLTYTHGELHPSYSLNYIIVEIPFADLKAIINSIGQPLIYL